MTLIKKKKNGLEFRPHDGYYGKLHRVNDAQTSFFAESYKYQRVFCTGLQQKPKSKLCSARVFTGFSLFLNINYEMEIKNDTAPNVLTRRIYRKSEISPLS